MEAVMMLLQHHADPNKSDQKGITALMLAAFHGHTEIVEMLLEHGADVNQENQKGGTALAFAVNQKKKNPAKLLLEHGAQGGKSIRQKVFDRILAWETPELSKLLLESIATIEIAVFDTHEKLTEAVHSGTIKIARLWIEQGADVNTTDEEQRTLLMDAAFRGNAEMVTLLLEQGADVRTATPSGWTAFDVADAAGYSDVVQLLIQAGAISEKAYAATKDLVQAARHGDLETARNALNNGANANARVFEDHLKGLTVLMMTAYYGHTQILELLLKHGAHVHATDDLPYKGGGFYVGRARGYTSLHFAVDRGHFEAADLLLKHGADINARGPLSLTSLIDASEKGNIEAVKFLIDRGADLTITVEVDFGSFNGLTALQIAEKQEHSEIVRLLKEAGAQ
jgi:ankyrin repeat protein